MITNPRVLEPLQGSQRVNGAFIYGPTGAGKTCTAEFLLDELAESADVDTTLVDCWPSFESYRLLSSNSLVSMTPSRYACPLSEIL